MSIILMLLNNALMVRPLFQPSWCTKCILLELIVISTATSLRFYYLHAMEKLKKSLVGLRGLLLLIWCKNKIAQVMVNLFAQYLALDQSIGLV